MHTKIVGWSRDKMARSNMIQPCLSNRHCQKHCLSFGDITPLVYGKIRDLNTFDFYDFHWIPVYHTILQTFINRFKHVGFFITRAYVYVLKCWFGVITIIVQIWFNSINMGLNIMKLVRKYVKHICIFKYIWKCRPIKHATEQYDRQPLRSF